MSVTGLYGPLASQASLKMLNKTQKLTASSYRYTVYSMQRTNAENRWLFNNGIFLFIISKLLWNNLYWIKRYVNKGYLTW